MLLKWKTALHNIEEIKQNKNLKLFDYLLKPERICRQYTLFLFNRNCMLWN